MAPIRVGIIGLGSKISAGYSSGEWGIQHLNAINGSSNYEVAAVCNSTIESAQKSIAFHKLDASKVKAYGSAKDIAADPNVDLIVVSVDVYKHFDLAKPVIAAGKDVVLEFPIAPTLGECEELAQLAKEKGVKSIIGTQSVADPAVAKLRELVRNKAVGDVVSTVMLGQTPIAVDQGWPESVSHFLDRDGGASRDRIFVGHSLAAFMSVVGDFKDLQSIYKTQTKTTTLLDATYQPSKPDYSVTSPDTVLIQGVLTSGAVATLHMRTAKTSVEDSNFRWIISGTEGEIEFTSKAGFFQALPGIEIKVRKWGDEAAQTVDWTPAGEPGYIQTLQNMGPNVARHYEAYAKEAEGEYASFDSAMKVHRVLDKALNGAVWAP